jgi:short-subunit dehydrogenase
MVWRDKRVFLTGASSGIGEALAVAMAKQGATLGLLARRKDLLEDLASRCEAAGGHARVYAADVRDAEGVAAAVEAFRKEFGHIDILVANAGVGGKSQAARDLVPTAVEEIIDINVMGAVNAVHAVLPHMLDRASGQLVAISSLAGFRGLPRSAAYSASKAAMTAFFESVRLDVAHRGVDVTIIQPGFIRTPLTAGREAKMPFLMYLDDAVPLFLRAIEKKKRFAAFPWQLASIVRLGRIMPSWMYDRIAGRTKFRE